MNLRILILLVALSTQFTAAGQQRSKGQGTLLNSSKPAVFVSFIRTVELERPSQLDMVGRLFVSQGQQHEVAKLEYVPDGRGTSSTRYGDVAYLTKQL